ncbi:hypothetical protein H0G86_007037 [Trichoderma simmonsii]|uniref:Uncharacterized protein n=1 Tax=Trichoderma simmonsii TaxID=1491479 RepID=A0A8G0PGQ1_9HYPO|nr:hypothetical protein H0G86_007037 [Trichoderma simmonsii]
MGCPLARDQTGTADIQIALWDGLAARHGKPPESGATHVASEGTAKKDVSFLALPCYGFLFSSFCYSTALIPWACMTKDDEVSSIALTDLFGPRRSGCELEGGESPGFGRRIRPAKEGRRGRRQMPKRGGG